MQRECKTKSLESRNSKDVGTFKCWNGKNRRGENEYLVKTGIKIAKQRYETEGRKGGKKEGRRAGKKEGRKAGKKEGREGGGQ